MDIVHVVSVDTRLVTDGPGPVGDGVGHETNDENTTHIGVMSS